MEAWKEEIASGKLPFESAEAVGSGKQAKCVAICTRIALNGAFFRHFRQDFFAYFS